MNKLPLLVTWPSVSSEYFSAMKIPLVEGRLPRDDGESERVAMLSESAARILWPKGDAIGKRVTRPFESPGVFWRIIGIVRDVRSGGLDRPSTPAIYRPYGQQGGRIFSLVVRTAMPAKELAKDVREAVARVDAAIPVPDPRSMPETIARSVQQRRLQALLLSAFAVVAVLLAAIGIYGVVGYSLLQRRKEIGVRLALGAARTDIGWLVFRHGMAPVLTGLASGLIGALVLARFIATLLFQVSSRDPLIFLLSSLILCSAAAIPCLLHARRAVQVDPVVALRLD